MEFRRERWDGFIVRWRKTKSETSSGGLGICVVEEVIDGETLGLIFGEERTGDVEKTSRVLG